MKLLRSCFSVFAMLFLSHIATAQTFTVPHDTITETVNTEGKFYNRITNTAAVIIWVKWKVAAHDFPADWQANFAICDNKTCESGAVLFDGNERETDTISPATEGEFYVWPTFSTVSLGSHYAKITLRESFNSKDTWYFFTKDANVGVATVKSNDGFAVFPNPASDFVTVFHDGSQGAKAIEVHSITGSTMLSAATAGPATRLDVSAFPPGVYFIRLLTDRGEVLKSAKFIHN